MLHTSCMPPGQQHQQHTCQRLLIVRRAWCENYMPRVIAKPCLADVVFSTAMSVMLAYP